MFLHHASAKNAFALLIFGMSIVVSSARAEPPLGTLQEGQRNALWIVPIGYSSMTVPLRGLEVGNADLEFRCVELGLVENRGKRDWSVWGAVSGCFDGDVAGAEGDGDGLKASFGFLGRFDNSVWHLELDTLKIDFDENPTDYEITGVAYNVGFMAALFDPNSTNIFSSNLRLGGEYTYARYSEDIKDESGIERSNDIRLKNSATVLARWSYTFKNGIGVSVSGTFLGKETTKVQIFKSFY